MAQFDLVIKFSVDEALLSDEDIEQLMYELQNGNVAGGVLFMDEDGESGTISISVDAEDLKIAQKWGSMVVFDSVGKLRTIQYISVSGVEVESDDN